MDGIISREDYIAFGKRYDLKAQNAGEAILSLEQEIDRLVEGKSEEQKWIAYFKLYQDIEELNRKLAVELIDRILVFENQRINIKFKFQFEYDSAMSLIQSVERINPALTVSSGREAV